MADTSYPSSVPLALATSSGLSEGYAASQGSSLDTGDLRRRYDFSERFSELAISQTPFFRLMSQLAKKPTDDPEFKFTEKRQSWMKRYAYVVGFHNGSAAVHNDATLVDTSAGALAQGGTVDLYMATDYFSAGNIQNVQGQSNAAIKVGDAGTAPEFFQVNQVLKVPMSATNGGAINDYMLVRITAVAAQSAANLSANSGTGSATAEVKKVTGKILKTSSGSEIGGYSSNLPQCVVYNVDIAEALELKRSYVVGSSYGEGSSLLGTTWKDSPYSTGYGQTQIFRTEFGMTNTARATALKYEPNEWARVWKDKLIEHKWDIEQSSLFSTQASVDSVAHTQGAVDYVLNYGNIFSWSTSKTADDFLQDMSKYQDPRYNQDKATIFLCSTDVYTWIHKLGGYFKGNIEISDNFRADLAVTGRKKVMGLDVTQISTVYGDMNVARCIALDGSHVKILGVNLNHVKYRPLVGNGVNRDTAIYVGVQSLENTGVDKRVDMILTEAGMEFSMPESHAIWK
ncbi:MAG: DUF5309 family protein [Anaerolineales bacterium]|jgi:hypothetical protein|nr:DUF5309 family protein [Anaerolineales bacterium]